MQRELLEKILQDMGVDYTHTATRSSEQRPKSNGRYSTTGDWIEEEIVLNTVPDGVRIKNLNQQTQVCDYCNVLVDETPNVICQYYKSRKNTWEGRCTLCKKTMDFATFMGREKDKDK